MGTNITDLYYNYTASPHAFVNISITSYNTTQKSISDQVCDDLTLENNPITVTNGVDYINISIFDEAYVDYNRIDLDGDTGTFGCNRTDLFTNFNTATGSGRYLPTSYGDEGIYFVNFTVTDGYGSIDHHITRINVSSGPCIQTWSNNDTGNSDIRLVILPGKNINFNVTSNRPVPLWKWFYDDVNQSHNYDNITMMNIQKGIHTLKGSGTDTNGTGNAITWTTIADTEMVPPTPSSLSYTTSNYWVNYTWAAGSGNVTDLYNYSINGSWTNGTGATSVNTYVGIHGYASIVVYAFNTTNDDAISVTYTARNITVPNNNPVITNVLSSYTINEEETLTFNADFTDLEGDSATFSDNSGHWNIDVNTGAVSWVTVDGDYGVYNWNVYVTDNHSGVDTHSIQVTVINESAPAPITGLTYTRGNFWINYTWNPSANADSYHVRIFYDDKGMTNNTHYNHLIQRRFCYLIRDGYCYLKLQGMKRQHLKFRRRNSKKP